MQLQTVVPIQEPHFKITYQDHIFCLGSCFVNEIGNKLSDVKLDTCINPFGTQFHPLAMEQVFSRIFRRTHYIESEIFHFNELYFSWDHSTLFSTSKESNTLAKLNDSVELGNQFLTKANVFIFTLGTAWAYYLTDGLFYVSNCHKVPQKHFDKHLLRKKQVLASLRNLILMCKDVSTNAKIIFTVSPIRHIRDGYRENNVSKGLLHNALNDLLQEFSDVNYFPSYEIVLDELRDYRFFKEDMVHLNELGVNYIWEKFIQHYLSKDTLTTKNEIEKVLRALAHKPINPQGLAHKKFLFDTLKKAEALTLNLPQNSLNQEIQELKRRIHAY